MRSLLAFVLATGLLAVAAPPVLAQQKTWKNIGDWTILASAWADANRLPRQRRHPPPRRASQRLRCCRRNPVRRAKADRPMKPRRSGSAMRLLSIAIALPLLAAIAAAPAAAQSTPSTRAGSWMIDEAGCMLTVGGKSAPLVLLRYKRPSDTVLLFVGSLDLSEKREIAPGRDYDIVFGFAAGAAVAVTMRGRELSGGERLLSAERSDWTTLLDNLAAARSVELRMNGNSIGSVDIGGGAQAVAALRQCRQTGGSVARPAPPPATSPSPPAAAQSLVWRKIGA